MNPPKTTEKDVKLTKFNRMPSTTNLSAEQQQTKNLCSCDRKQNFCRATITTCAHCKGATKDTRRKSWCFDSSFRRSRWRDSFTRRTSWDKMRYLALDLGAAKNYDKSAIKLVDQSFRKLCNIRKAMTMSSQPDKPSVIFDSASGRNRWTGDLTATLSDLKAKRKVCTLETIKGSPSKPTDSDPVQEVLFSNSRNIFDDTTGESEV